MRLSPEVAEAIIVTTKGIVKGATKGGIVGAGAALGGAAVVATLPWFLPVVGGAVIVSPAILGTWAAVGATVGGATQGGWEFWNLKRRNDEFVKTFGKKQGDLNS